MNYVKSFNMFGTEVSQIPCIRSAGAPTTKTEGDVGSLYMDTVTGEMYKCVSVTDGFYTWGSVGTADNATVGQKPWTSKTIADKLCPPFTESGAAVICEPLEGYPLDVVSTINYTDTPTETITLKQCGKNILDVTTAGVYHTNPYNKSGDITITETGFRFEAIRAVSDSWQKAGFCLGTSKELAGKTLTVSAKYSSNFTTSGTKLFVALLGTDKTPAPAGAEIILSSGGYVGEKNATTTLKSAYNTCSYTVTGEETHSYIIVLISVTYGGPLAIGNVVEISDIQVEIGNTATSYESYRGQTFTVDLSNAPELEDEGFYDWNTGLFSNGASEYLYLPGTGEWYQPDESETHTIIRTIPALPGVNCLHSNCGDTTVSGRSDCNAVLKNLTNAIISLGGNV